MPVRLALLKGYISGKHSFKPFSQELNFQRHRTFDGKPFTEISITIKEIRAHGGKLGAAKPQPEDIPLFAYRLRKENQIIGGDRST